MPLASSQKNHFTLAGVCLASLMFGLEISSVPVILPTLETVLHSDFNDLQWIMNAYTIACTTVLMATGTLADRYGRKRLLVGSLALFGMSSMACGLAGNANTLIAARILQGVSGGAMLICQVAVLSHRFPSGMPRGRAFSTWGIVFGLGLGFGPIIGAAIVALSSWQWVFLAHGPLTVLALVLVVAGVDESRDRQHRRLDLLGIASLSLAVFGIAWYITQGPVLGFTSVPALTSLLIGGLAIAVFVWAECRHEDPMFDFSVFRIRLFSGALFGSAGMNFSFWPCMIFLPLYFQNALGYDALGSGLALLAYTLPTLLFPPLGERLAMRHGPDRVIPLGLFTIGLGFMLMKWGTSGPHASAMTMLPGSLLAGIGLGLTNTPVTNTTTAAVPGDRAGMASGIDLSARMISLSLNIALMGYLFVQGTLAALRNASPPSSAHAALHALAERLTAGSSTADGMGAVTADVARAALAQGFGWVLLYGGVAVWVFAALSLLAFGRRPVTQAVGACS
ncbi:MFS transporter [Stenotrophomonas sp.]|uniref:MFS transporter n=1 Tax=Stenotrophomonas sp. TaxID=69392 RepID=UPI0028A195E9|nr:MFS transporter [Stenotrophomonas sp.]